MKLNSAFFFLFTLFFIAVLSGCTPNTSSVLSNLNSSVLSATTSSTSTSTSSIPSGAMSVKIIFTNNSISGSFNTTSFPNGTVPGDGLGVPAVRFFDPSATSTSPITQPSWLNLVEVGFSGTSNTASTLSSCARFAGPAESIVPNCNLGAGANTATCGAASGQLRVSEYDCVKLSTAASGNGGGGDGIYIRAQFNRNTASLGAQENILAVIEYFASAVNPAPLNPTSCLSGGSFVPENCSEYVWKAYLRATQIPYIFSAAAPFLLLIPPTNSSINYPGQITPVTSGTTVATKQFILPLATNSSLTTLQLSRSSTFTDPSNLLGTACAANSPLCSGVIFYSLTLYRI